MLKMTIDNEEVLSNNDISIKEEILSPSSTILNNVYPKSWELDKDYTSRFYYPKDYSKLNIQNFSIEPEEAGKTIQVNGSATLTDVDTSKESRVLRLLGQTSQDRTPTPTSPIPINVVSGDNTINICGKNLYDLTTTSFSNSNVDITINDQEITMKTKTQTNSGNFFFMTKIPDEILQNGQTYTISSIDVSGVAQSLKLQLRTKTGGFVNGKNRQDSVVYDDTYSLYVDGNIYSNLNSDIIPAGTIAKIKNIQVEKGSTATTYEPYIGNSYPIYLGVENLFDKNNANILNNTYMNSSTMKLASATGTKTLYIPISGGKTYTIKKIVSSRFAVATTTSLPQIDVSLSGMIQDNSATSLTITTDSNAKYLCVFYLHSSDTISEQTILDSIVIEIGSKANHPSTTPIELCKIGTYQDYIYKDNGSWYLHKEIGKAIFVGNENYSLRSDVPITGYKCYRCTTFDYQLIGQTNVGASNYFGFVASGNTPNTFRLAKTQYYAIQFIISESLASDVTAFKTWLSTHNTIVYYVLTTPTNTEITDTTLIEQLEALSS